MIVLINRSLYTKLVIKIIYINVDNYISKIKQRICRACHDFFHHDYNFNFQKQLYNCKTVKAIALTTLKRA